MLARIPPAASFLLTALWDMQFQILASRLSISPRTRFCAVAAPQFRGPAAELPRFPARSATETKQSSERQWPHWEQLQKAGAHPSALHLKKAAPVRKEFSIGLIFRSPRLPAGRQLCRNRF